MSFSLSGLASGMDTNKIVSELMQINRKPYEKLEAHKVVNNEKVTAFRSINTSIMGLWNKAYDLTTEAFWNSKKVSFANEDQKHIDVTANSTADLGTHTVRVKQLAENSAYASSSYDPKANATHLNGETFTLFDGARNNRIDITIEGASTMEDVLKQIANGLKGSSVNVMSIKATESTVRLAFSSSETGVANAVSFGDDFDGRKNVISISDGLASVLGLTKTQEAKDAILEYNSMTISRSTNKITDLIEGVTLDLKKVTGENDDPIKFTIEQDTGKIKSQLEEFFTAFNDISTTLTKNSAKGSVLNGNFSIRSLQQAFGGLGGFSMRYSDFTGDSITSFGIEFNKGIRYASDITNTFSVDYDKLFKKLEDDENATKFLTGFFDKAREVLHSYGSANGILTEEIRSLEVSNATISDRMERMNMSLEATENRLLKQFQTMETMLSSLNSTQSWLTGQLEALNRSNK